LDHLFERIPERVEALHVKRRRRLPKYIQQRHGHVVGPELALGGY
jgi:hypothetical protein